MADVLLLQGPIGPFFRRFARLLRAQGHRVRKINFNAGDWLFYPGPGALAYRGGVDAWPDFLAGFLRRHGIERIYLFGDCRPMHRCVPQVAGPLGVRVFVFEEGYVRPDYVTLEEWGVNGHSRLPRDPAFYRALPDAPLPMPEPVGQTFGRMACHAMAYVAALRWLRPFFPGYAHHRPFKVRGEVGVWLRAWWRKRRFAREQASLLPRVACELDQRYFLVALQTHTDAQIVDHSRFVSVTEFIAQVLESFARAAPADTSLVFKHHPLDRGYTHYGELLARLAREHGLAGRVFYVHDLHLPTLIRHARGAVMVNSTVGMSVLYHRVPLKVLGRAIYDMPGLTFQGALEDFWREPGAVDMKLYHRFRTYLIRHTQVNGSFYKRLSEVDWMRVCRCEAREDVQGAPGVAVARPAGRHPPAVEASLV
ncbi:capsular polysaccharide export protein [Plasticicumulans lactativorans]|uniref:Capsular polysaccharide export protein n=1 Tax=Plasticicumulans lactativorans TaxID=1133106 RepID=A0A4R2L4X5_9GAMM|nr:capsular biosynthesis protein [Plasticicumulans lactativorans]TCO80307.1 capsular polysaccharide export protein [Plasticicumulans lactativorans]